MKYALVFLVLVLATAAVFSTTREECYSEVASKVADLHAQNAAQNPAGSLVVSTYGCGGTCTYNYQQCYQNAEDGQYASCVAAANVGGMTAEKGSACITQLNAADLQCANTEIDCCSGQAQAACNAQYAPAETGATTGNNYASEKNDCVEQYGGYAEYDPAGDECYCPEEYTFYNQYIGQCVHSGVYSYCDGRNAVYDEATDSCLCKSGYVPAGESCVQGGSGSSSGGQALGMSPSGATGASQSSGGTTGAGTCFIVAPFALLALAVLAGKRI